MTARFATTDVSKFRVLELVSSSHLFALWSSSGGGDKDELLLRLFDSGFGSGSGRARFLPLSNPVNVCKYP